MTSAAVNRYAATLGGLLTWAIKKRIAPRDFGDPCRRIARRPENSERIRFLTDSKRLRVPQASREATWDRLYLLVLWAMVVPKRIRRGAEKWNPSHWKESTEMKKSRSTNNAVMDALKRAESGISVPHPWRKS